MLSSSHRFVKGSVGRCVPLRRTSRYSAVAIPVISREWSLDARNVRLDMWIVAGSEVMVRRYTRARWYVPGGSSQLIGRSGADHRNRQSMLLCLVAHVGFLGAMTSFIRSTRAPSSSGLCGSLVEQRRRYDIGGCSRITIQCQKRIRS